jgi:hypothetical protein
MTEAKEVKGWGIYGTCQGKRLTDYLATESEGSTLLNENQKHEPLKELW